MQRKNEILRLFKQLKEKNSVEIESKIIDFKQIIELFSTTIDYESPDEYLVIDDTTYMLEHFQVSIFENDDGGDLYSIAVNSDEKQLYSRFNKIKAINLNPSVENLYLSTKKCVEKHIRNYSRYLENIKKVNENRNYKLIFLIEDISNDIIIDDKEGYVTALFIFEIVNELVKYEMLDGVICFNKTMLGNFVICKDKESMKAELMSLPKKDNLKIKISLNQIFLDVCRTKGFLGNMNDELSVTDSVEVLKNN
ncbi:MAG: hypothetical protein R3Y24_09440 [Eubacteriales bacterium]